MNDIYLIEHKRFLFCNGMVHIDLGYSHSTNLGWLYLTLDGVVLGANKKLEFCRLLKGFSSLYKIWRFYTNTQNFKKMMRPPPLTQAPPYTCASFGTSRGVQSCTDKRNMQLAQGPNTDQDRGFYLTDAFMF